MISYTEVLYKGIHDDMNTVQCRWFEEHEQISTGLDIITVILNSWHTMVSYSRVLFLAMDFLVFS